MEELLNKQILEWWHLLPDNLKGNMPTFIHPLNINADILFVGLNPSGDTSVKEPLTNISDIQIQEKIELETRAIFGEGASREGQYKTYYAPLSDIADTLGVAFEHCDLFQMSFRTASVVVSELFGSDKKLKPCHSKHLSVFKKIFDTVKPRLVITNNVISAKILKDLYSLKFDDVTGMYISEQGTYFFLNGIMSYGRQTIFDKERLLWAVKKVL